MATNAPAIDLSKYIEIKVFGDRPHIRGRRMPVATVAACARDPGWDVATLAREFTLSEPQVLAALLFYAENTELIDRLEQANQRERDEVYEKHQEEKRP